MARWVDSLEFEQEGPLLRMRISGSQRGRAEEWKKSTTPWQLTAEIRPAYVLGLYRAGGYCSGLYSSSLVPSGWKVRHSPPLSLS